MQDIFYFIANWGHMNQDNSCFVYKIRKNKRRGFPEPVRGRKKMDTLIHCCRRMGGYSLFWGSIW